MSMGNPDGVTPSTSWTSCGGVAADRHHGYSVSKGIPRLRTRDLQLVQSRFGVSWTRIPRP